MRNEFAIYILILLQLVSVGCKRSSNNQLDSCEKGIQKAEQDANKGKYEILSYGLPFYEDLEFQMFYENYLKEKFGIIIGNGGCVIYGEQECYTNKMNELVLKIFGDDFFEQAKLDAQIKYDIHVQKLIESDHIFTNVDIKPEFNLSNETISSYLNRNLKNNKKNYRIRASFIVDEYGDLSDITIEYSKDQELNNELIKVLSDMPKWKPGTINGHNVRTKVGLPITFEKEKD